MRSFITFFIFTSLASHSFAIRASDGNSPPFSESLVRQEARTHDIGSLLADPQKKQARVQALHEEDKDSHAAFKQCGPESDFSNDKAAGFRAIRDIGDVLPTDRVVRIHVREDNGNLVYSNRETDPCEWIYTKEGEGTNSPPILERANIPTFATGSQLGQKGFSNEIFILSGISGDGLPDWEPFQCECAKDGEFHLVTTNKNGDTALYSISKPKNSKGVRDSQIVKSSATKKPPYDSMPKGKDSSNVWPDKGSL